MAKRFLRTGIVCAALLAFGPANAQDEDVERWQDMSEEDLSRNLRDFLENVSLAPCSRGVPTTQEWVSRHSDRENVGALIPLAQMYCAVSREQKAEALAHYLAFEAFGKPFDPFMGLQMAGYADNRDEQVRQLRLLLLESEVPLETTYAQSVVNWTLGELDDAEREDEVAQIALQAARAGRLDTLGADYASAFAFRALDLAVTDAPEVVPVLLRSISHPSTYLSLLADRKYAEIWPQVEARVGLHLLPVMDEIVARTQADLAAEPASAEALNAAAYALNYAKRHDELNAMVEQWRARPDAPDDIDEDLAWAINLQGFALHALGRMAEADEAMAEIANMDEDRFGWVVNFAINHASRIVGDGRYAEGLVAVDRARVVTDKHGSTYARLLVARDRACALERLGRHDEAMLEQPYLSEHLDASLDVAGTGLLCLGQREELVQALTRALADEEVVRDNYALLQRPEVDLFYLDSVLPSVPELVQAEPALRDLMERYVRVIPDEFVPNI